MNEVSIAFNRFGLGRRPSDASPRDPREWLVAQFDAFRPSTRDIKGLSGAREILEGYTSGGEAAASRKADLARAREAARDSYWSQAIARVGEAISSDTPFVERLVHFWANHFAISADTPATRGLAGPLEFEAIRPHVLGRFEDLLLAVERHPAMMVYLDQVVSIGPNSNLPKHGAKLGLNENLAREIMELHTLGVHGGYSQADVTEFARALTGWTVAGWGRPILARASIRAGAPGTAVYVAEFHEPGARRILGKSYPASDASQATAVLQDLAHHRSTARFIAIKLARHFISDDPPESLVSKLAQTFEGTQGNLPAVYRALIEAPESWQPQPAKFRSPWLWGIAIARGLGLQPGEGNGAASTRALVGMSMALDQPIWRPGSPAGWEETAQRWASPDQLYKRVEVASRLAGAQPDPPRPVELAQTLFGADLSNATRRAIAAADSAPQGISLLFVSPEMTRC